MGQPNPTQTVTNPRIGKLIELEVAGRIKPEHQQELDILRAQGLAPKKSSGNSLTEYQGKSTGFYERAIGADRDFLAAGKGGEPVGLLGDAARSALPENIVNTFTSADRQKAQQAREDFIRASLRYESGAAIGGDEFTAQDKIFFPQTGDTPEVVKQKAEARRRVIESLKVAAGPGADNGDKYNPNGLGAGESGSLQFNDQIPDPVGWRMTPEQQAGFSQFVTANQKIMTPGLLQEWAKAHGLPPIQNIDEYVKGVQSTDAPPTVPDYTNQDEAAKEAARKRLSENNAGGVGGALVMGAGDTASLGFLDEAMGGVKSLYNGKSWDQNTQDIRAEQAVQQEDHFPSYTLGQLAGGAAIPVGSKAKTVAEMTKVGGGLGTAYGVGSGTDTGSRFRGGVMGGVAGAATGAGFAKLGDIWRGRGGPTPPRGGSGPTPQDTLAAAERIGVDVLPADVGGPLVGRLTAGAAQTPFGAPPILSKAARAVEQGKAARDSAASAATTPAVEEYGAGRAAQRGLTSWIKKTDDRTSRLYDAISVEPKTDAIAQNTRGALKEITQGMESNPELSRIWTGHPRLRATLEALTPKDSSAEAQRALASATAAKEAASGELASAQGRLDIALKTVSRPEDASNARSAMQAAMQKLEKANSDIASAGELASRPPEGGNVSWEDTKRLRSIVGEIIGSPSLSSEGNENAAMRKLYAALSEDMRATAEASGPKALREFERANSFTRAREDRIKNVLVPILGKDGDKGGQAAFTQIQNWSRAKGETARMAQMMRSLPKDEAETVSATLISNLGKVPPGRQGAAGNSFSLNDFLTHWNQLDKLAKNTMFTPGQRSSLEDLAIVAEGTKAGQRFANTSNTAGAIGVNATTGGLGGAMVAMGSGHPLVALALSTPAIGQHITGRMMASPHFVRWLAKAPANPAAMKSTIGQLSNIAAKSPALSADLATFESRLLSAMNDNTPASTAASEDKQNKRQ